MENKYCKLRNLRNESDVEQFFVVRLLGDLDFSNDYLATKTTVKEVKLGKGKRKRNYRPDYIGYAEKSFKKPILIVDAKHPSRNAEEGLEDAQQYAANMIRAIPRPKPSIVCIGTNGTRTVAKHFDSDDTLFEMKFEEFQDGNRHFEKFIEQMSRSNLAKVKTTIKPLFEFREPEIGAIQGIFEACHNLIWKTEKRSPASAFYEFSKLMFIKLSEDKKLRERSETKNLIESRELLPRDHVVFSTHWVEQLEDTGPNPVNTVLFANLKKHLEGEIARGKKKRIFDKKEEIDLSPSTIKEVVKLLQHYDLAAIDEDLNGRLFETFLTATMRGRDLGQYFTPRSVVKFMVKMADLRAGKEQMDFVLDGCCGTGGFLIEAMTDMCAKIENNSALSSSEKQSLISALREKHLWGVDAGKDPPIPRIARLNMYLHRDGGSRIYFADFLDKDVEIEPGTPTELEQEMEELQVTLGGELLVDTVLTNPPFAMRYEWSKPKERRILQKYELVYFKDKKKPRSSVKSAVMFLERYHDLLKRGGKLLTVMDESILNTKSNKAFRDFIREKFIVRAVVSLPRNTFVKADSSVKTSVLYLEKKRSSQETQPAVFMAISDNVGHTDTGKERQELNDLPKILEAFRIFQKEGRVP